MAVSPSPLFIRSLDDMIRTSDQHLRDGYFSALLICTIAVLIGVIFEEAEIFPLPIRRFWIDPKTGLIVRNHNIDKCIRNLARFGWVLIIVGVLGEGLFEELASRADSIVQTFDEILTTEAQQNALEAQKQNIRLGIELAKQEQDTANAVRSAAEANAKLGGWRLDDAAKVRFAGYVKKYPGTPFDLAVNPIEAPFMESLDAVLTSPQVGWIQEPPKPTNGQFAAIVIDGKASTILSAGITLEVDQDQGSLQPAIIALGKALHTELGVEHIPLHLVPPGSWGHRIHIIIGRRE